MASPSRSRSLVRSIVRRMPAPLASTIRSLVRSARASLSAGPRRGAPYPASFRSGHHIPIERPWPDPPFVANPIEQLTEPSPEPIRSFDLELFETLNAEHAAHPIVTDAPLYDADSIAERSRRRLSGVHDRIGLAGLRVLEVGCGAGYEVWYLAHHFGSDAWGVDISARRSWPALQGDRVHLIEADIATDHDLTPASFDRAISFAVWEHITRPEEAFRQLYRLLKPHGLAWVRANLYRGPNASHRYRDIYFPFPHLLFHDDVIAKALERAGKPPVGAAWVNKLTWEQYEAVILAAGFRIRSLKFDIHPLDEAFHRRFEDVLGRYPRTDLERTFFTVVLEKPA